MIYAVIVALAEWLEDPDTGPNTFLPDVEREPNDATLEVPPFAAVLQPFRDEEVFKNVECGRYPALYVTPAGVAETEGEVNQGELNGATALPVLLRIVVEDVHGPRALRVLDYQLTALNRSISAFFADSAAGQAARQRRHVQLLVCASRSYALAYEDLGAAKVGASLLLTITTRDTEAA